jgi:CubicO group peptidase (beta-lactamase class C family)
MGPVGKLMWGRVPPPWPVPSGSIAPLMPISKPSPTAYLDSSMKRSIAPYSPARILLTLTIVCLAAPASATGQEAAPATAQESLAAADLSDVPALTAWLDGFMASHIDELPSAGATVSIVQDGEVLLARGFGLANVEDDVAVDAGTLFRIGSVSKLFTWTAVMQLVEQGLLDLDTDINEYMTAVQLPDSYDEPVTLSHLLTHTPGFEDHVVGLFGSDAESLRSYDQILQEELPLRVRPVGEVASYSNHGTGMAAHIVEVATGMSFEDYIQENILDPLGMTETTIAQPVPAALEDQLSRGYSRAGGDFDEEPFEYVPLAAVGAVSSSANDMAKLMIAYLQEGRLGDASILSEETAIQMREPLFRHAEQMNAGLHGFMDMSQDGQWIIGHGGDTFWFHTAFAMLPEHEVGLFVSYNTDTGAAGRTRLMNAFLERYFPVAAEETLEPSADAVDRLDKYSGAYRNNRFVHSDFTKVGAAIGAVTVSITEEGALTTSATGSTEFVETSAGTFRASDDHDVITFRENESGEVTWMFLGTYQVSAFERLRGLQHPTTQMALAGIWAIMLTLAVIFWPVTAVVRWRYKATPPPELRIPRFARVTAWVASTAFLAFAVGLGSVASGANDIALGDLGMAKRLLGLGSVAALLGLVTAGLAGWVWMKGRGGTLTRVVYSLVAFACLIAIWQMSQWNLLGFKL